MANIELCVICKHEFTSYEGQLNYICQKCYAELLAKESQTLRDQFAMAALQGLLANCWLESEENTTTSIAREAYMFADAMIEERGKME